MRALVVMATAWLLAAAPADAAPALTVAGPCASWATPLALRGSGFTPGGKVELSARWSSKIGVAAAGSPITLIADAGGAFSDTRAVPAIGYDSLLLTVTARDETRTAAGAPLAEQYASTAITVAWPGAYYRPWNADGAAPARPGRAEVLDVSGFIDSDSRTLYIHYLRNERLAKTLRIGRLVGPCGSLSTQLRQFDFTPVPKGTYGVRFDTTRAWPNDDIWTGYDRVVVGRRAGTPAPARRRRG